MNTAFDRKLRQAAVRLNAQLLLERLGFLLLVSGVLALVATLCHRILAWPMLNYSMLIIAAVFVSGAAAAWWFVRRPTRLQLAIILDERVGAKERFSTAPALARVDDPFAQAANAEAHDQASGVDPRNHFPVRPTRRWLYAACAWALAAAVLAFVPDVDALGLLARRQQEQEKTTDLAKAISEIKAEATKVEATVKQLGDSQLAKDLDSLKDLQAPSAQDAKRQAIEKLGDMGDRIKELQKQRDLNKADALKEMLEQAKTPYTNEDARKISQAVAKGEYGKAAELLKEVQKKIQEGKLSDKEKQDLAKQLGEFGKQLDELAKDNKPLKDELEKAGQDKELAEKTLDEIREELKKQGLTDEQVQKIMERAGQCKSACDSAGKLAEALKKLSGQPGDSGQGRQLTPDELAQLEAALLELDGLAGQLKLSDKSLDDLEDAIIALGEGEGELGDISLVIPGGDGTGKDGLGGQGTGAWQPGAANGQGSGTGGSGQGYGKRPTGKDDGSTKTVKTRVDNPAGSKGKIIASQYIKGAQVKGEAKKQLGEVVQSAKDSAAQAITDNQIPRKYEGPIKKYYGQFEPATPTSGPSK